MDNSHSLNNTGAIQDNTRLIKNEYPHNTEGMLDGISAYRGSNTFERDSVPMVSISLSQLIDEIRTNSDLRDTTDKLRSLEAKKSGDISQDKFVDDRQSKIKTTELPFFTLSEFKDNLLYNKNLIGARYDLQDLDHLDDKYEIVKAQLLKDPYVFILFRSPRGNGLKVIREYDQVITDPAIFKKIHTHFGLELGNQYSIKVDPSTHDAARACFLSSDPDVYVNPDHLLLRASVLSLDNLLSKQKKAELKNQKRSELASLLSGVSENRNNALIKLIGLWLDSGMDEDFILLHARNWNKSNIPPLPDDEVDATVKKAFSLYKKYENLDVAFETIRKQAREERIDDVELAKVFFRWLRHNQKAHYFTDENDVHYVYAANRLIPLNEKNPDFNALLLSTANITTADKLGKVTVSVLNASAHLEGKRIRRSTWLETRIDRLEIFLNLKNSRNEILKINPNTCEVISNGSNDDNIFMLNTTEDKVLPIEFQAMSDTEFRDALLLGNELIAKHIPCSLEERWFAYGWRLAFPLYDFTTKHITLRAQGASAAGKSTACDVLSLSLYGESLQGTSTTASLYRDAAINPLVVEDNLESRRFYADEGHGDFYLLAATGGVKQKSAKNTDSGVINERIRALVLCNGIESIAKSEQTNRMMIIHCDKTLYNSKFTDAVFLDIKRNRNALLSANFFLTQKVLGQIKAGRWREIQERLAVQYPNHAKHRMFEHIAIIILYLEEHQKVAGIPEDVWSLVEKWMSNQTDSAFEEIVESDPIIQALELIRDSALKQAEFDSLVFTPPEERLRMRPQVLKLDVETLLAEVTYTKDLFVIEGSAGKLLSGFAKAFQTHLGKQFPIATGAILSQRINEVTKELKRQGYDLSTTKDKHNKQNIYRIEWTYKKTLPADAPAEVPAEEIADMEGKNRS